MSVEDRTCLKLTLGAAGEDICLYAPAGPPGRTPQECCSSLCQQAEKGKGSLPSALAPHSSPFWTRSARGRRRAQLTPGRAFLGQTPRGEMALFKIDRVGGDEIACAGPAELQCLWFGPLSVCPQLFLLVLVLPQVFQIECLHSCFCSSRNRHKNPSSRPRLTERPCAKEAKGVVIAVRNELSAGPREERQ